MSIMKLFEKDYKVNFVDENSVLVGYGMEHQCCEDFGWYIRDQEDFNIPAIPKNTHGVLRGNPDIDLTGYFFDTFFIHQDYVGNVDCVPEQGIVVVFRMHQFEKHERVNQKYLHLFNKHNGYYTHGFAMSHNQKDLWKGKL
jgi:hypothetical protein